MTIEERFEKLEMKLARARVINRMLVVFGVGLFLVLSFLEPGTPTAQESAIYREVHASAFVLFDENGFVRANLTMVGDGPTLELYDEIGTVRAELSVLGNAPYVGLFDKNFKRLWQAP